jgi:hypothetical protein
MEVLGKIAQKNSKARRFLEHYRVMMRLMDKDRDVGDVLYYSNRATEELKSLEFNADDASPESVVLTLIRRVCKSVDGSVLKYIQRKKGNVENYLVLPSD